MGPAFLNNRVAPANVTLRASGIFYQPSSKLLVGSLGPRLFHRLFLALLNQVHCDLLAGPHGDSNGAKACSVVVHNFEPVKGSDSDQGEGERQGLFLYEGKGEGQACRGAYFD
jgi:hypothetical protein